MTRPSRCRAVLLLTVGAVIAIPSLLALGPRAAAQEIASFTGVAASDAFRMSVAVPGASVVDVPVDAGGLTTQATVDSLGNSVAFASSPYPGDVVISLPGLISGFTGVTDLPTYPAFVRSNHPTVPSDRVEQPGFTLDASSNESASVATATTGSATPSATIGGQSTASVVADEQAVVAEASTLTDVLDIGPVRMGAVRSVARVERTAGGEPVRSSSLEIGRLEISGLPVGITGEGLEFLGTQIPLPVEPVFGTVEELLASSDTSITVLEAEETETGVIAPGLRIVTQQEIPGAGFTATVTITVGRAMANVSTVVARPPVSATPSSIAPAPASGIGSTGGSPTVGVSTPPPNPPVTPTGPSAVGPSQQAADLRLIPVPLDFGHIYPVLVGAGLVFIGCVELNRYYGTRWKWTS